MKKIVLFGGLIIQVLFADTNSGIQNREFTSDEMKIQNRYIVKIASQEMSKDLPQKIDKYTTFVAVKGKDLTLEYIFEVNIGDKKEEKVILEDTPRMKKAITSGVCNSSKRFLDANIDISYIYLNETTKNILFQVDINKALCFKIGK